MGTISTSGSNAGHWHWFTQNVGPNGYVLPKDAGDPPKLAGLPAIPKMGPDANDIAAKEAAMQGLSQRMQSANAPKFAMGDPSQTPLGTKTLLGS